ncbi:MULTISPECIES: hypothetical protein [Streptomyces]|uniref:IrrE N-terminal-like domain-containing protein n=3 Tax=Streptomyces TaxID=1883 RepID=A0ABU4KIT9_9ACTN|nr:hypothetical protein [Streptomyces roseolus]MDX2297686.1 hypothetical protein [Streptomyces roseolus]
MPTKLTRPGVGGRRAADRWGALRRQALLWAATRQARRLINRDLGLMGASDMDSVVRAVEVKQGKRITTVRIPLPPEVSAFCIRGQDRDYVVVDAQAGQLTQAHAILHELFHLWKEHPAEDGGHDMEMDADTIRLLMPGVRPEAVLRVLTRSHYARKAELGAETFATTMLQRLHLSETPRDERVSSTFIHRSAGV